MQKRVYTSQSGLRSPLLLIAGIIRDISEGRHLGWRLFVRNISAKYRLSFLGIFWAILPPLATSLVWIFLNSQQVVSIGHTGLPYPVFVIVGTMLWQIFTEALTGMITTLSSNKNILVKLNFPREALLLTSMWETLFNTVIKVILLIIVFFSFDIIPTVEFIQMIPGIFGLLFIGWTIGLLLIPISMLIPDINNSLSIVLQFAMYLTPVIYPQKDYSGILSVLNYNPVAPFLTYSRDAIQGQWLPSEYLLILFGVTTVFFLLGLIVYRLAMPILIERMGS